MGLFSKAEKKGSNLWCAIYGISGSGKTMTALRMATGMGGKIAVIDTERGSASKYADRFTFDTCKLVDKTIAGYCKAIEDAGKAGYKVLIVDSMTHAWRELLEEIDNLATIKYGGNSFRAWSEGTPKQADFIDTLLNFNGHIIATMRSNTEWSVEKDKDAKTKITKVGLKPEQGKGIEYEFDLLLSLNEAHTALVEKDRTGKYQDKWIPMPDEKFGAELAAWVGGAQSAAEAKGVAKEVEQKPVVEPHSASKEAPPASKPAEKARDSRIAFFWGKIKAAKKEADFKIDDMKMLPDEQLVTLLRNYCMAQNLWQPKEAAKTPTIHDQPAAAPAKAVNENEPPF